MTATTERLAAALADRYRIERELGQGGMATVFLAEDLKHKRKVALKVLKPELAAVLGAERFVQEITTTAALQHPHILPLFDSGTADGFLYYVMPFIQGETLRDKLNRETQLGIEEAVKIATEVADALHYAHTQGVIHRDIKPENILLHDGRPMVADFGIALAVSAAAGGRMTETGLSLGTPHYMSPEQATAEKEITGRSDIYSLGSVLYEMLTENPPHTGASAQQIIMKIIAEPAQVVTKLRKSVPPNVAAAVAKALEKLPADRFESAKAFADALKDVHFRITGSGTAVTTPGAPTRARVLWGAGVAAAAAAGFLAAWTIRDGESVAPAESPVMRFERPATAADSVSQINEALGTLLADASGWVAIGNGRQGPGIYVYSFAGGPPRFLPATDVAVGQMPLPDGSGIAYYTFLENGLSRMRVAPMSGGPSRTWTDSLRMPQAVDDAGWLYATHHSENGLARVDPTGRTLERLTSVDSAGGEARHSHPDVLPGGRAVVFQIMHAQVGRPTEIAVLDLRNRTVRRIAQGMRPRYLESGYLVFSDPDGTLHAGAFDLSRLEFAGTPVPVLRGVRSTQLVGAVDYSLTRSGALLYDRAAASRWSVVASAPGGSTAFVSGAGAAPRRFRIHPDGRQLVIATSDGLEFHAVDGSSRRLSRSAEVFTSAWSPDGAQLAFVQFVQQDRAARRLFPFVVPTDGVGATRRLALGQDTTAARNVTALDWANPGIVYSEEGKILWLAGGSGQPVEIAEGLNPRLSPDGRFVAYTRGRISVVGGGGESVFVSAVPPGTGAWEVAPGVGPKWSPDGRSLYFAGPTGPFQFRPSPIMRVAVVPGRAFAFGATTVAAEPPEGATLAWEIGPHDGRIYWVTAPSPPSPLLVVNWGREVDSLVRAAGSR